MALIDGVKVNLRGRDFVIPPLTLAAYEKLSERIEALDGASTVESFRTMRDVIHAAMSENYPDLTAEDLTKLLDVGNLKAAFSAVMAKSSEGKPAGETPAP